MEDNLNGAVSAVIDAPQTPEVKYFGDADVSNVQVAQVTELMINPDKCGPCPNWRSIFKEGNALHPGCTESRIIGTGDVIEGEDTAIAFDDLYHVHESKVAFCNVPSKQVRLYESMWESLEANMRGENESAEKYDKRMSKAVRGWVRSTLRVTHRNTRGATRVLFQETF